MFNVISRTIRIFTFIAVIGGLVHSANILVTRGTQIIATTDAITPLNILLSIEKPTPIKGTIDSIISDMPTKISIGSLDILLAIEPGYYDQDTKSWTLADGKAFFATLSDTPSTLNGNTVIYAHNRDDAFEKIRNLTVGDIITIETHGGKIFTYKHVGSEYVNPENDAVFYYKDSPRLTLLTCNGSLNETRLLLYAELVEVTIN